MNSQCTFMIAGYFSTVGFTSYLAKIQRLLVFFLKVYAISSNYMQSGDSCNS